MWDGSKDIRRMFVQISRRRTSNATEGASTAMCYVVMRCLGSNLPVMALMVLEVPSLQTKHKYDGSHTVYGLFMGNRCFSLIFSHVEGILAD